MAETNDENRARIIYTQISRMYNSSISHFLTLIVAWLAFVYASQRIPLDWFTFSITIIVLVAIGWYSWIRVLNFKGVLDQLETILNLDEFRHRNNLYSFRFMEFPFRGKRYKGRTIGEIIGSLMLLLLYLFTIFWILQ